MAKGHCILSMPFLNAKNYATRNHAFIKCEIIHKRQRGDNKGKIRVKNSKQLKMLDSMVGRKLTIRKCRGYNSLGQITAVQAIKEIKYTTAKQASAIDEINLGLSQVSAIVQANAATASESSDVSEALLAQVNALYKEVSRFQLKKSIDAKMVTVMETEEIEEVVEEIEEVGQAQIYLLELIPE